MPSLLGVLMRFFGKILSVLFALLFIVLPASAQGYDPSWQSDQLWLYEAQTIYLSNLERAERGIPPLRWNQQLTHGARWFAWDTTTNNANKCTHQDTNGQYAVDRAAIFGYKGLAGAENAFCGFVSPADAVAGWMVSGGHRDNLLDPNSREVGVGYYGSPSAGYIAQAFGVDRDYAPVVINNEMPSTTSPNVDLYIYDPASDGWGGFGKAQEMQISDDACFTGAAWQPYQPRVSWTLEPAAQGWQPVYVRTRDALHRTRVASDVIYYGSPTAGAMTEPAQMSTTVRQVTLLGLDGQGLPLMQFSLGWQADDSFETFDLNWGKGEHVDDTSAWGGTAFKLTGSGSRAWVWTTDFPRDLPMTAYVRLRVDSNDSSGEVIRVAVENGASRALHGTDFHASGVYQEFALPLRFNSGEDFLIMTFETQSSTPVYVDTVTFFSQPVPVEDPYTWQVPGQNYRGQGVWVRYVDENLETFSQIDEGSQHDPRLAAQPNQVRVAAVQGQGPYTWFMKVMQGCGAAGWSEHSDAGWFALSHQGNTLYLQADPDTLGVGLHRATITIISEDPDTPPLYIPVELEVIEPRVQYAMPLTYMAAP